MYYTPDTLSEDAIQKAGPIALEFNLPIKDVAMVIETLKVEAVPDFAAAVVLEPLAHALRPIIAKIAEPIAALQRFAVYGDGKNDPGKSYLTLPVVAAATGSYRFDALVCMRDILQTASFNAAAFDSVDVVQNPRRAMIVSKMALAGYFWSDMFDHYPDGEFEMTEDGLEPTPDSGLEFVARVVNAADPGITMEEMAEAVPAMRDYIGETGYLKEIAEEKAAEEAERVVK